MFEASNPDAMNTLLPSQKNVVVSNFNYFKTKIENTVVSHLKVFFSFLTLLLFTTTSNAAISGPTVVCANAASEYTVPGTTGYSYIWNVTGAAQSAANSNTFNVTWGPPPPTGLALITLIIKNQFGVTVSTLSLQVAINPLPVPKIMPLNTNGCTNTLPPATADGTVVTVDSLASQCYMVCDSTVYEYKPVYPNANHSYVWSVIPSNAAIGTTVSSGGNILVQWGAASPNQISLRLMQVDNTTGCADSVDLCIQIIPRPNANFSAFPAIVNDTIKLCLNSSVAFFDQSSANPNSTITNWLWKFGDGSSSILQSPVHTYNTPGFFKVKLLVINQCYCKDSMEVNVKVDSLPGPDIYCVSAMCANGNDTYCTGATCSSYSWSVGSGTITGGAGTSCIDVQWGNAGPGSITLQGGPCAGSCAFPTSVLVPILTPTTIISGPNPVCISSINYYSVPIVPSTSYTWNVAPLGSSPASGTIIGGQGTNVIAILFDSLSGPMKIAVAYSNPFLNCSGAANATVLVAPSHELDGDAILCDGVTGSYTTNSASSSWTVSDASGNPVFMQPTGSSLSFTFPGPGAYIVYASDLTGTLCSSPAAYQVQVMPLPPPPAVSINTAICPGQTLLYTGVPSSNNYYLNWAVTGGVPNQTSGNAISITWSPTGPWTINLSQVMVLPPSCASNPTTYVMSNPPPPAPPISGPATTCWNKLEAYSTTSQADNYQWFLFSNGYGSIIQGANPQNVNVVFNNGSGTQTATLQLIVTVCGATNSTNYYITVSPPPAPAINIPTLICQGQAANFSSSASGSAYAWTFGDGSTGPNSGSVSHAYANAVPYLISLTVTNPGGCIGSASSSSIINVNPTPVANVTSPNPLVQCLGGAAPSVTLFASAQTIAGSPTYTWAGPVTGSSNSLVATQVGTYTMYVNINGCVNSTTVQVDTSCTSGAPCTYSVPGSYAFFNYGIACSAVNFTPTLVGAGGQLLSWSFGDIANSTSTASNPSFTYNASGFYNVTLHCQFPAAGGGWCKFDTTMLVTVPIYADFKYNFGCGTGTNLNTIFINQSNWLPTTSIGGYTWSASPGGWSSNSSSPTAVLSPGTYTVQLTIQEAGGSTVTCTQTKTLVVPQRPAASFTVATQICEGNPLTFTPTVSSDIVTYEWDFGDGSGLVTMNPNPNGVRSFQYAGPGVNINPTSLRITDTYGCTHTVGVIGVQVYKNLFTPNNIAVSPSSGQFCQGDSIQLCAIGVGVTNSNTPYTYNWTNFKTTNCIYASQTGSYGVIFTDALGCVSLRKVASVGMIYVPAPLIAGDLEYCEGDDILFSIDKGNNYTYQWLYNFPTGTITASCTSPLFPPVTPCPTISTSSFTVPGTYTLQGLITEQNTTLNCTALGPQITYTIHPLPASPTVGTNQCGYNLPLNLTATPFGANILWNTGASGNVINAYSSGKYWASLIDVYGCKSAADSVYVWPLPDFNSVLTGCYDICDSGNVIIPAPPGYSTYEWIKIGLGTVLGPSTIAPTSLTLNAGSPFPGGNAGDYVLVLTTPYNCTDTSAILTINTHPCEICDLQIELDSITCVQWADGNYYNFTLTATYGGTTSSGFSLGATNGSITAVTPTPNILNPGVNVVTGSFYPEDGETHACFSFTVSDAGTIPCIKDTCVLLPPCPDDPPCLLEKPELSAWCEGVDANGNPIYTFNLSFIAPTTGTVYLGTSQGIMTPTNYTATSGVNYIGGTFTDTPGTDAVYCININFFDGDDWCYANICTTLNLMPPCIEMPPPCTDLVQVDRSLICYTINAQGVSIYSLNTAFYSMSGAGYSYTILSSQGVIGATSPTLITGTTAVLSASMLLVPPYTSPVCFTLIATNTLTAERCYFEFCVEPVACDEAYYRLINSASLSMYPNPTHDYTIVEYTIDDQVALREIQVIDLQGRVVYKSTLSDASGKLRIDTSQLIPGMYFIKAIHNERDLIIRKLIIE